MRRTRPGRPRHIPARSQLEPREQILDAAARLFTERGFAATSTREIAEMVGMRQASLYYHFPCGKEEILGDLLDMTVRPTLDGLDELAEIDPPEAKLYVLAFRDARALAGLMHNIGLLPTLPDVTSTEVCDEYEQARRLLREAYSTLGISCASDVVVETVSRAQLGAMVIQQVEGVVRDRAAGEVVTSYELHNVAAACLRICGVPDERIPSIGDISPLLTDAS
ncbi:MAG TPA: helix-turn-helix domain-containing protein [Nocardioides sp.]